MHWTHCTHGQSQTNMHLRLLRSWGHKKHNHDFWYENGTRATSVVSAPNYCNTDYYYFFFNSVLRPFQDYFISYETGRSVGGAETGEPREKTPDTPASRTWLVSHVARAGLEPTPDTAVR